ncbi:MAG TPA: hypothetical protein VIL86_10005 [Tepidisphaeraceae bacterium]|jgi:hypothetical protein
MKKILTVLVVTLALNFLLVAGGAGWLYSMGKLNRASVLAMKDVLFPPPQVALATTQPAPVDATTQPSLQLERLLADASGRSALEQVELIQHTFDIRMAELDRREREIKALQAQVAFEQSQAHKNNDKLEQARAKLASEQQEATKLAGDKGFQDSLALYNTIPPRQVKTIFMSLDDQTVEHYLQAMQPRAAAKIIKEFKSADELQRIQRILEQMRQSQVSVKE